MENANENVFYPEGIGIRQSFKLEGTSDRYYPVVFKDNNWENGFTDLDVFRPNVHEDITWYGSLVARFTFKSSKWGHFGPSFTGFLNTKVMQFAGDPKYSHINPFLKAQNAVYDNLFVVYLRGNTTYHWSSLNNVELFDASPQAKSYTYGQNKEVFDVIIPEYK